MIGDWIQTYTGKQFWPLDPRSEDVSIEDIAHALALKCRFSGHCRPHYSVAQHSVLVSRVVPAPLALHGLLHDAAEAYTGDISGPVKKCLAVKRDDGYVPFDVVEDRLLACVAAVFGMDPFPFRCHEVLAADRKLLGTEVRDLMVKPPTEWSSTRYIAPCEECICALDWQAAELLFLERFYELKKV